MTFAPMSCLMETDSVHIYSILVIIMIKQLDKIYGWTFELIN